MIRSVPFIKEGDVISMDEEAIRALPDKLCYITLTFKEDQETGGLLALKAIREAGASFRGLLGPVWEPWCLERALGTIVTEPVLDREVVAQLAIKHIADLSAFDLMLAIQVKYGDLPPEKCLQLPERLLALHRAKEAVFRASCSANGLQLATSDADSRRASFVAAVLEPRADVH